MTTVDRARVVQGCHAIPPPGSRVPPSRHSHPDRHHAPDPDALPQILHRLIDPFQRDAARHHPLQVDLPAARELDHARIVHRPAAERAHDLELAEHHAPRIQREGVGAVADEHHAAAGAHAAHRQLLRLRIPDRLERDIGARAGDLAHGLVHPRFLRRIHRRLGAERLRELELRREQIHRDHARAGGRRRSARC